MDFNPSDVGGHGGLGELARAAPLRDTSRSTDEAEVWRELRAEAEAALIEEPLYAGLSACMCRAESPKCSGPISIQRRGSALECSSIMRPAS